MENIKDLSIQTEWMIIHNTCSHSGAGKSPLQEEKNHTTLKTLSDNVSHLQMQLALSEYTRTMKIKSVQLSTKINNPNTLTSI